MTEPWMLLAITTFCVLALTAIGVGRQSVRPVSDTYLWTCELVAFDATARAVTVKSRVAGEQALAQLPTFTRGDRIVLTWSGFETYAEVISRAIGDEAAKDWNEPFTLPVEFVAYESARQCVTFKFPVPASSVQVIQSLEPGEWLRVTSRHQPSGQIEAISGASPCLASLAQVEITVEESANDFGRLAGRFSQAHSAPRRLSRYAD